MVSRGIGLIFNYGLFMFCWMRESREQRDSRIFENCTDVVRNVFLFTYSKSHKSPAPSAHENQVNEN